MSAGLTDLKGRTAVITGAASGFGRELALQCAAAGMQLVLTDVDEAGLAATQAQAGAPASRVLLQRCDVAQAEQVQALAAAARQRFGAVHLLFNNAGVIAAGPLAKATPQDWQWVMGVNLMGVAHGIGAFVPDMLARGEPAWVVNTASLAGLVCPPELGVYAASKHAVVALSECLHHELAASGRPVGVSLLCPAYVDTGIADSARHRPPTLAEANPDNAAIMARTKAAMKSGRLSAADVARITLGAVKEGRFYIFPSPKAVLGVEGRLRALLRGDAPDNPLAPMAVPPGAATAAMSPAAPAAAAGSSDMAALSMR
jgi:NAD(P)-dependent dehydrogenase (short-subunit alcohol dehydrogenase family)